MKSGLCETGVIALRQCGDAAMTRIERRYTAQSRACFSGTFISCLSAALLLLAGSTVKSAAASKSQWTATINTDGASAANCKNCDEDISVLLTCERGTGDLQVMLMLLEQRDDAFAGKPAVVSATADADTLALAGTYSEPGLIGPYPVLTVPIDGPFLELLSHANQVSFLGEGQKQVLDMSGSRTAISKMKAACR